MLWLRTSRQIAEINVIKMKAKSKETDTEGVYCPVFDAWPLGTAPFLIAWSMSGSLSGFNRRVDRLPGRVQWAGGTRWLCSKERGGISFYSLEIKQASGGETASRLSSYWVIIWRGHSTGTLCGSPAAAGSNRLGGNLTWEVISCAMKLTALTERMFNTTSRTAVFPDR